MAAAAMPRVPGQIATGGWETLFMCDDLSGAGFELLSQAHPRAHICRVALPLIRLSSYGAACAAVRAALENGSVRLVVVTHSCGSLSQAMRRRQGATVASQEVFARRLLSAQVPEGRSLVIAFERF